MEILCLGGSCEVGRNMFAVKSGEDVVILDIGLQMDAYIQLTEDQELIDISEARLAASGAIPDIRPLREWKGKVKAICISHAHLDHIGAVQYLAHHFNCPIYATPFTIAVIKEILVDQKVRLPNKLIEKQAGSIFRISPSIKIEFVSVTHSVPQSVMIVVHTPEGLVAYANDFKLDKFPVLGSEPNIRRMKELSHMNVKALIIDTLYSNKPVKTPSERVAKEMLRDVLIGTNTDGKAIILTTFASHIARLKSIVEFAEQLNRKPVFLGRSLAKYLRAAESVGLAEFARNAKVLRYGSEVGRFIKKIRNPSEYLFVVTGHQGEPKATLSKMVRQHGFPFKQGDFVVFSCAIIPTPMNVRNRASLEEDLRKRRIRIFTDIHVSGHASREDHRELIEYLRPEHLFPVHGTAKLSAGFIDLAREMDYKEQKIHLLSPGKKTIIP